MIPYLKQQIAQALTFEAKQAIVREYLQMRILSSLQSAGAMIPLAFQGGTALRLLFHLPRFSEDLDFALERQPLQYDLRKFLATIESDLASEAYNVEIKLSDRHIVHSAFVRFRGLYHQLNISPYKTQALAIKLEIDTNPPAKAQLDTTLVQRHVTVHLQHHNRASLYAGKLYAILQRQYAKGRDWYDLYWYLRQKEWPHPNFDMLNNALYQSGWDRGVITADNWKSQILEKIKELDWEFIVDDVKRFLIEQDELSNFNKETLETLLLD